jgi:hypothetical protein
MTNAPRLPTTPMPLTENEKKELDLLDNPEAKFTGASTGAGLVAGIFSSSGNQAARKKRVVNLRMKLRGEELNVVNPKNSLQEFRKWYALKEEMQKQEEERFDKRFAPKPVAASEPPGLSDPTSIPS